MGDLTRSKKQETRQSVFLKVVHPRGYVEIFREPVTAGEIMSRYPRHCITRTDFFEYPWIVVRPESVLVPGKEFFLVPYKTVDRVLKEKRQQLQSPTHCPRVTPRDQQEGRCCRRQTDHRRCNDIGDHARGQFSDGRGPYKESFNCLWNRMRGNIRLQPHEGSCLHLDLELEPPVRGGRPHVTSPEQLEFQSVKSCLRKADTDRKKLNLKVSFASPVVIPGSQRESPSVEQDDLVLQVWRHNTV